MNPLANSSTTGDSQTETSDGKSNVSAENDDAFRWNVRPSDKAPTKRWVVLAVAILAFALGYLLFRNVVFGLVGFAIILLATAEFWLGISYKVDSKGVSSRVGLSLTSMEWSQVQRAIQTEQGIQLSPLTQGGRMDAFRGVYLRFGANRESVIEAVRRWLPTHVELMGG